MKTFLTIILFLGVVLSADATSVYYLALEKDELEYGVYSGKRNQKQAVFKQRLSEVCPEELVRFLGLEEGQNNVIYFHCWLGGFMPFHKNSIRKINGLEGVDKLVCVEWNSEGLKYAKNIDLALDLGRQLSPFVSAIAKSGNGSVSVLCHSMGHRVFEGVIANCDEEIKFNKVLFAAADLDVDVFKKSLLPVVNNADEIVLYCNAGDRALKVSKKVLEKERMGFAALERSEIFEASGIVVFDATPKNSKNIFKNSGHTFFKRDPVVLADIDRRLGS